MTTGLDECQPNELIRTIASLSPALVALRRQSQHRERIVLAWLLNSLVGPSYGCVVRTAAACGVSPRTVRRAVRRFCDAWRQENDR